MVGYIRRISNALSTFTSLMIEVLKPFEGYFVVIYFNDILLYKHEEEVHKEQLKQSIRRSNNRKLIAI